MILTGERREGKRVEKFCECTNCNKWRKENLPYGSIYHTMLTQESYEALQKANQPKGRRAARRKARGL